MALPDLFDSLPGLIIVLTPDLHIEAATDAYLRETHKSRGETIGSYIFDVFPESGEGSENSSLQTLRASLKLVLSTGKPHKMDLLQYDLPDSCRPGEYLRRYWSTTNTPVLNENGQVIRIIHETVWNCNSLL